MFLLALEAENMSKIILTEDTVIEIGKSIPLNKFRTFFEESTGKQLPSSEFQPWLNMQAGKTLKEAIAEYCSTSERKSMQDLLSEKRFEIISQADKAFILAFDKEIEKLGYDYGGGIGDGYVWGKYMIVYAKTGVNNKKSHCPNFYKRR